MGFEIYGHKWNEFVFSVAQTSKLAGLCVSFSICHGRKVLEVLRDEAPAQTGHPASHCTGLHPWPGHAVQLPLQERRKPLLLLLAT